MTTKDLIIQELDRVPESLLEQILNFIQFLRFMSFRGHPSAPEPLTATPDTHSRSLSDTEKLEQLKQLFGAWADQPDLNEIFRTIDQERHADLGRDLDLLK